MNASDDRLLRWWWWWVASTIAADCVTVLDRARTVTTQQQKAKATQQQQQQRLVISCALHCIGTAAAYSHRYSGHTLLLLLPLTLMAPQCHHQLLWFSPPSALWPRCWSVILGCATAAHGTNPRVGRTPCFQNSFFFSINKFIFKRRELNWIKLKRAV